MPAITPSGWTDERVALLKKLWLVDLRTASECAAKLGGVTRNAVVGKIHRLGLTGARSPETDRLNQSRRRRARQGDRGAPKPKPPKPLRPARAPKTPAVIVDKILVAKPAPPKPVLKLVAGQPHPESLNLPLEALRIGMCKWPIGDGPFVFCGCATPDPTDPVQPYCAWHMGVSRRPVPAPKAGAIRSLARGWTRTRYTRSSCFKQAAGGGVSR